MGRGRKEGISLHGLKVGLLKILYFGNPTLLDKSIMKRMIGVCPKVFVVVEMDGQPKGMRILRADLATNTEIFHPGYFGKFLQGRKKISFLRRTRGMLKAKGYGVFHGKEELRVHLEHDFLFGNVDRIYESSHS